MSATADMSVAPQPSDGTGRRNIVVLSDGTGNSSSALFRTNVWRLYKALDLRDPPDPNDPRQFALYDDGVGSSSLWPLRALGGAFGWGLARNVRELYAFVCRTHRRPEDRIYAFGFSRGAFTARIVVGLIHSQGLMVYDGDEAKLARDVAAAYRAYRAERFSTVLRVEIVGRFLVKVAVELRNLLMGYESYEAVKLRMDAAGRKTLSIAFVGVWDTVAAYGLPIQELTRAVDKLVWPLSMPNADLGVRVERAMHALSLDDERQTFHPELWNEGRPPKTPDQKAPNEGRSGDRIEDERLSQVWFAGVHADVGGGYPDDAASYAPLQWIMDGAQREGLKFIPLVRQTYEAESDENGVVHRSRTGAGGVYRYTPRRVERIAKPPRAERPLRTVVVERVKIHESALRRLHVGQDGYATIAPPPDFDVVTIDNRIRTASAYFAGLPGAPAFSSAAFGVAREHVYNLVWLRRVAYFWTLAAATLLAAFPAIWPAKPDGACLSWPCFAAPLITPIKAVAPSLAAPWLDSFSSNPGPFTFVFAALAAGLSIGSKLEGSIANAMRLVWSAAAAPGGSTETVAAPAPGRTMRAIERIRLSRAYKATFRTIAKYVLPAIALVCAVAFLAMVVVKTGHEVRSSIGWICASSGDWRTLPDVTAGQPATADFSTADPCRASGVRVQEGATKPWPPAPTASTPKAGRRSSSRLS